MAEIYWIDRAGPGRLAIMPRPRGGEWLQDEIRSLRSQGVDLLVSLLEAHEVEELELKDEAKLCRAAGIRFLSHPVPDHDVPESFEATRKFIRSLAARVRKGRVAAIHCRAGIGRSATIAGGVLVSLGLPLPETLERLSRARGMLVPETQEQHEWLERLARPAP
jgi:protein-tyrosine phosphatase